MLWCRQAVYGTRSALARSNFDINGRTQQTAERDEEKKRREAKRSDLLVSSVVSRCMRLSPIFWVNLASFREWESRHPEVPGSRWCQSCRHECDIFGNRGSLASLLVRTTKPNPCQVASTAKHLDRFLA